MEPSGEEEKKLVDPVSGSTCSILGASSCPTDHGVDHYISPSSEDECTREGTSSWMFSWSYAGDSVMRFAAVSILGRAWIPEGGRTGEERGTTDVFGDVGNDVFSITVGTSWDICSCWNWIDAAGDLEAPYGIKRI
jgi:hypothetical protein